MTEPNLRETFKRAANEVVGSVKKYAWSLRIEDGLVVERGRWTTHRIPMDEIAEVSRFTWRDKLARAWPWCDGVNIKTRSGATYSPYVASGKAEEFYADLRAIRQRVRSLAAPQESPQPRVVQADEVGTQLPGTPWEALSQGTRRRVELLLDPSETGILAVDSPFGPIWLLTDRSLIDLREGRPKRYEISAMSDMRWDGEIKFRCGPTLLVKMDDYALGAYLAQLWPEVCHPTAMGEAAWLADYASNVRPWDAVPPNDRRKLEPLLVGSEAPLLVIQGMLRPQWLLTDRHIVNVHKRPPRRYELDSITDLTWKNDLSFSSGTGRISVTYLCAEEVFWYLVRGSPQMARGMILQDDEKPPSGSAILSALELGCLADVRHVPGTYMPPVIAKYERRYEKVSVPVYLRSPREQTRWWQAGEPYYQFVTCPRCRLEFAVEAFEGGYPAPRFFQPSRLKLFSRDFDVRDHVRWPG